MICVFIVARKPHLLVVYVCMSLGYEVGEDPTSTCRGA